MKHAEDTARTTPVPPISIHEQLAGAQDGVLRASKETPTPPHLVALAMLDDKHERRSRLVPPAVRTAIADIRALLEDLETYCRQTEPSDIEPFEEQTLVSALVEAVAPRLTQLLVAVADDVSALQGPAKDEALALGQEQILPLLGQSCIFRRATEKPRGYAGDYRQMTYYYGETLLGKDRFSRLVHGFGKSLDISRSVVGRHDLNKDRIVELLRGDRAVRIASVACGPAEEIVQALLSVDAVGVPVEFFLIDQDEEAVAFASERLKRVLASKPRELSSVTLRPLNFGVRQILKPTTDDELRVVNEVIAGLDFVYAAGLFDYLSNKVAKALVRKLYELLNPGGAVYVGNLRWSRELALLMDLVMDWSLIYREPSALQALAVGLEPTPANVHVDLDVTGKCGILNVRKPGV